MTIRPGESRRQLRGVMHRGWNRWLAVAAIVIATVLILIIDSVAAMSAPLESGGVTPQRGFALPSWEQDGYDGRQLEQAFGELAEVGATWVQFNPTWYQETPDSNDITRWPQTVSDAGLERAISLAHGHGLRVFLKPHVDLRNPAQNSRSTIRPSDPSAWFASYTTFIGHYAEMADRLGVEQFAVATELASVSDRRGDWLDVIREVRSKYDGIVTYAADANEYTHVSFWDAVDVIGIDAYWPLSPVSTTDEAVLQRSWEPIRNELAAFSVKHGRKILFTEAGYTSQEGSTTSPYSWMISSDPNQAEQAVAYQALLATFSGQEWWAGVYWWVWNVLPDIGGHALDYSPRGKTAEWVIRNWWST